MPVADSLRPNGRGCGDDLATREREDARSVMRGASFKSKDAERDLTYVIRLSRRVRTRTLIVVGQWRFHAGRRRTCNGTH